MIPEAPWPSRAISCQGAKKKVPWPCRLVCRNRPGLIVHSGQGGECCSLVCTTEVSTYTARVDGKHPFKCMRRKSISAEHILQL